VASSGTIDFVLEEDASRNAADRLGSRTATRPDTKDDKQFMGAGYEKRRACGLEFSSSLSI
jgi:hypothetical protein